MYSVIFKKHFWSGSGIFTFHFLQDPFGEKRGRFDYQGLLTRLRAIQRRLREKCPPEDNDSDSDTSSSGTDPDSQGSSQP